MVVVGPTPALQNILPCFNCSPCLRYTPSLLALLTGDTGLTFICLLLFFSAAFMLESQTQVLTACLQDQKKKKNTKRTLTPGF